MNKAVFLLMLSALIAGCKSTTPNAQDDSVAGLRCWHYRDQNPITQEQVEYIQARSENGDRLCKGMLASLYERGHGVPQDIPKAKALYQSLAEVNASAYYQLGRMEEEGIGEPTNYVKARQFYQLAAAEPGNENNATHLAKLMEEGKGGPQDLEGALALYVNAIRYSEDKAWKSVQRLRAQGLVLTAEQERHYNEIWVSGVQNQLGRKIWELEKTLSKQSKTSAANKPTQLQLAYIPGSVVPQILLLESSGDSTVDQAVLQAMSDYRFPDEPIQHPGEKTWKVTATVNPSSK
ncbi:sel1 repeat family protein [Pseudomonas gingeri]|uniref:Sel1 repeat family protein n=1 Tax=Pseudomonas gingeri TaxID=117681 RepID=A0A7Y7XGP1_9PSED|nr:tetratricopeptide repeat protein [Pseudomonas gingeri]NWB99554.1 sel1 repeat family protein [Pseudomonas gingeri]